MNLCREVFAVLGSPSEGGAEELALEVWGCETVEDSSAVRPLQAKYIWEQLVEWHKVLKESLDEVRGVLEDQLLEVKENRLALTLEQVPAHALKAELKSKLDQLKVPAEATIWKVR